MLGGLPIPPRRNELQPADSGEGDDAIHSDSASDSVTQSPEVPVNETPVDSRPQDDEPTWVTLGEAADLAGVSISAVRGWQRSEQVRSRLGPGPRGEQRLVLLDDVRARAKQRKATHAERRAGHTATEPTSPELETARRGRYETVPRTPAEPAPAQAGNELEPERAEEDRSDLTAPGRRERAKDARPGREETVPRTARESPPVAPTELARRGPDSSAHVVVPLEAWQRIVEQLANLHEVGQQHAEARERAARAEATVEFLRERIRALEVSFQEEIGARRPRWWRRGGGADYYG
jgi:hypothetical protein